MYIKHTNNFCFFIAHSIEPSRVPDTLQLSAISAARAFCASRFINNFPVFNGPEYSDSPCLHHLTLTVI